MANVWAIADLHLSFGVPNKKMDLFGQQWRDHPDKVSAHWEALINDDDLVLLAGDLSWAKHLDDALVDLHWIGALPGTKVMIRGNHDYWWSSLAKLNQVLPPSLHYIQNNAFNWNGITIAGARLWDSVEYRFDTIIHTAEGAPSPPPYDHDIAGNEKIFERELLRLERSLQELDPAAHHRIAMTHYPPIGLDLAPSRASKLLERYGVEACIFGHLHNVTAETPPPFGEAHGVRYLLTAADFLAFTPLLVLEDIPHQK